MDAVIINKKRLRKSIDERGMQMSELFARLGTGERSWYRWKRDGFPRLAVCAICYVLGVTEKWLTGGRK